MNIHALVLGLKGLRTIEALGESGLPIQLHCQIGRDSNVQDDYSAQIAEYCRQREIPFTFRGDANSSLCSASFVLAVGWRWMIRDIDEKKLLVFHDSLLPRYRGFAPLVSALLNREPEIGVTALFGADEYDRGHIIAQCKMNVKYPTTIQSEIDRISHLYARLSVIAVSTLLKNPSDRGSPQNEELATYSLWRDDEDYRINWSNDANYIQHFVACLGFPYLGASTTANDRVIRILSCSVISDVNIENRTPGKVIFLKNSLPVVVCGKGLLKIERAVYENGEDALPFPSFRILFK